MSSACFGIGRGATTRARGSYRTVWCVLALLLGALQASAQTGAITGSVLDPSGGAVPEAEVVVRHSGTGVERHAMTDARGRFLAEALPVGTYDVEVTTAGFKRAIRTGLQLTVADRLAVDFILEIGQITESIAVAAEAPLLKTETGDVSYFVTTKQITDLSVNNRNFLALQQLVPGASRTGADELPVGLTGGKGFAFNGQRDKYSGVMIDGVQNTAVGNQTTLMTYPGLETVAEMKILSSNYSAEYGTAGGANMLVVTRSGTRDFHGAFYEYVRNDKFDARNFFAAGKPTLRLNNFGYRIGGPVAIPGVYRGREKTFFFFAQEWRRRRSQAIVRAATPTDAMRNGDFSAEAARTGLPVIDALSGDPFENNRIPASRINSNASLLLGRLFPSPNNSGFLNFQQNFAVPENWRQELIRVDHNFTENTRVMFRFIHESWFEGQPLTLWSGSSFPTISSELNVPAKNFIGKLTKIINPSVLTEVSFGYTNNYGDSETTGARPLGNYARPDGLSIRKIFAQPEGLPSKVPDLSFTGGWGNISSLIYPWWAHQPVVSVNSLTTKVTGSHALKFGGEYQFSYTRNRSQSYPSYQGSFTFSGAFTNHSHADFLAGQASTYGELDVIREPRYDYHNLELFIQDDWKVSPRLTLNLGVRYFYIPHIYEKDDVLTLFRPDRWDPNRAPTVLPDLTLAPGSGDLLNGIAGVQDGLPRGLVQDHPWKFGPRLAFAYDLTGQGRTVVRGGYGIGFYRVEGNDAYQLVGNPPFANIVTVFNPPLDNPGGGTVGADRPRSVNTLDPVYDVPMVQTYSFGIQQRISANSALSVSYIGTRGTHLDRGRQLNYPGPVDGFDYDPRLNTREIALEQIAPFQGWSGISQIETTASSTYHSLQVDFNRAFDNGMRFQAAYTYSKTLTDADGFGALPQNPRDLRPERALASFDRTHVAVFNYVYELPLWRNPTNMIQRLLGGWQLSGITAFQSGTPINVGLTGPTIGLATRPDVAAGVPLSLTKTPEQWFSTQTFQTPGLGYFGNAGRNLVRGPGINKWDIGVFKNFRFGEESNLQFRWETFNTFNHPSFLRVSSTHGAGDFGAVVSARDARVMQFGLKLEF